MSDRAPAPEAELSYANTEDKPLRDASLVLGPRRIGRYVLLRTLGQGGMGVVHAAYDEELDRKVALKVLHPGMAADVEQRKRILREAQALARVSDPHVIHVYEVGEFEGQVFLAMEFVNGTTLTQWQKKPRVSWRDILRMSLCCENSVATSSSGLP